jgi:hypothetical protein
MNEAHKPDNIAKAYDRTLKSYEMHAKQIESFSIAAMRAPSVAAAGGIAATLAFYTGNYSRLVLDPLKIELVESALFWFFISAMFSVLTPGAAYFSQLAYLDSLNRKAYSADTEFAVVTPESKRSGCIGHFFRWLTVTINVCAIVSFIYGGIIFLRLI